MLFVDVHFVDCRLRSIDGCSYQSFPTIICAYSVFNHTQVLHMCLLYTIFNSYQSFPTIMCVCSQTSVMYVYMCLIRSGGVG